MHEATRLQALALLGIEQWVPRDAAPESADVEVRAGIDAAAEIPADGTAVDDAPPPRQVALPGSAMTKLDALLPGAGRARTPPPFATTPANEAPPSPLPASAGERLACALLPAGDGLLLIADFSSPEAPGLSGDEASVLLRLAAALAPGRQLPEPSDLHWPPRGARLPGMDRPGAAREALVAQLREQYKRGVRDVLLLGDATATLLGDLPGVRIVRAPSLAAMAANPALKKACWTAASPLKRPS